MRVFPAQQDRSRETMRRIEEAALRLLEQLDWRDLTMAGLAREAKASVGSIYARFETKAALLEHLDELYARELLSLAEQFVEACRSEQAAFGTVVEGLVRELFRFHRQRHGLIRVLVLEARTAKPPSFAERSVRMNEAMGGVCTELCGLGLREGREIDPVAMGWALCFMMATIREIALFPGGIPRPDTDDAAQADQIVLMVWGYLDQRAPREAN